MALQFIDKYMDAFCLPVSSTGGVAKELYDTHIKMTKCPIAIKEELEDETIEYQNLLKVFLEAL